MSIEVSGKIKLIRDTETVGDKGFKKRELVLETDEQYPQFLAIEFVQDKCDLLDKFNEGDNVGIGINLRGREWIDPQGEAKYFNSIQGWLIKKLDSAEPVKKASTKKKAKKEEEDDDLPF